MSKEVFVTPKGKLPDRILPIRCIDKKDAECWYPGRNLLDIPGPFRACLIGPPSSGKSTAIKNLLLRAKPAFEEILVTHYDSEGSHEWDQIASYISNELPDPLSIDRDKKRCLIIEDLNLRGLPADEASKLNRLCGYTSSHCNLTIFITCQNYSDLNSSIRRMCNVFIIFRSPDVSSMATLSNRVGLTRKQMIEYLQKLDKPHDSLWIDLTSRTPAKIRINGFEIL